MQIVIDIDEELYEACKGRPPMLGDERMDMIAQSIANGASLPKGHGRLIDADALLSERYPKIHEFIDLPNGAIGIYLIDIHRAPTIVQADKE